MLCDILKTFPFSRDGVTSEDAAAGGQADIPADLVPGLKAAGYIREAKALDHAPENKMLDFAPENKGAEPAENAPEAAQDGDDAPEAAEVAPEPEAAPATAPDAALTQLLTDDEINADIMAMPSVDFDPREPKADRLAKRNAGRAARDAKAGA